MSIKQGEWKDGASLIDELMGGLEPGRVAICLEGVIAQPTSVWVVP